MKTDALALQAERRILLIRQHRVMLDNDLAALYVVEARALNQAVKRNLARFPPDFMFQLTPAEADHVRGLVSQSVSPAPGEPSNSSQTVMSSRKHRGRSYVITKDVNDFSVMPLDRAAAGARVKKIPAPLACYWLGWLEVEAAGRK